MTTVVGGASTAGELEAGLGNSRTGAAGSGAADTVRNAVVATVVGIGCLATLIVMAVCVVLHCHFTRDKGHLNKHRLSQLLDKKKIN